MRRNRVVLFAVAGLFLSAVSVRAHHAFAAEFDVKKPVHVTGVITKVELTNPHSWIYLDAKGADGQISKWAFETAASPNALIRRGFTKASLQVGVEVVIDGFQAKDGSFRASGSNITLPDGKQLFIGATGSEPGAAPTPPAVEDKK